MKNKDNEMLIKIQECINTFCEYNSEYLGSVILDDVFDVYNITLNHINSNTHSEIKLPRDIMDNFIYSIEPSLMMELSQLKSKIDMNLVKEKIQEYDNTFMVNSTCSCDGSYTKTTHIDKDYSLPQMLTLQQIEENEPYPFIVSVGYNTTDDRVSVSLCANDFSPKFIPIVTDKIADDAIEIMDKIYKDAQKFESIDKFYQTVMRASIEVLDYVCHMYKLKTSGHLTVSRKMRDHYHKLKDRPLLSETMSFGKMIDGLVNERKTYTKLSWGDVHLTISRHNPELRYDGHCKPISMPPYIQICKREPGDYIGTYRPFVPCYDDMFANDWVEIRRK